MIFAFATDDRSLMTFSAEEDAVAYCEGLDVEAGGWLFWDGTGAPLKPKFIVPNQRGFVMVTNGRYRLIPARESHRASLVEILDGISTFEGSPPNTSAAAVREFLQKHLQARVALSDGPSAARTS